MFGKTNYDTKGKLLKQVIYELFTSQCKNVKELYLQTSQPLLSFPGASTCFSQIYNLRIDMDSVNSDNVLGMAQICKNLYSLSIYNCSEDVPGLTSLIIAQKNLNELYLYTKKDIKELHQCLAISKFPDLKNLGVTGLSCFKELATLIEKTNGKISRIYVYTTDVIAKNSGMLIEAIANNCPKIKFLRTYLEPKGFINMKSLLLNCKHLENLRLDNMNYPLNESDRNIGDKLLNIFTEFSPESLINLTISEDWEYSVDALVRFRKYINEGVIMRFDCTKKRSSYWEFY